MNSLKATKSILAKLLATEDISVQFKNTDTASFNTERRILTIPQWKDISSELYDLLVGHEVGHALETPNEGWLSVVEDEKNNPGIAGFVNIVEDARIERHMKDLYPGLRRSFYLGYQNLIERGFFGISFDKLNTLNFIDRINIHFKAGSYANIDFSEVEFSFVEEIENAKTWEDVVDISYRLYEYCKNNKEFLPRLPQDIEQEMDEDLLDDSGDFLNNPEGGSYSKPTKNNSDKEETKSETSGDTEKTPEDSQNQVGNGQDSVEKNWTSSTVDALKESLKSLSDNRTESSNGYLPKMKDVDHKKLIVPWKQVVGKMFYETAQCYSTKEIYEFESKNKNAINYLVKEFEMRKRASELRRTQTSDTGTIDTNSLHSYKFNDNIFKKLEHVADGKNHGMVMLIDWSGSMETNVVGTVEQTGVLASFCRKVGIPFEVYLFSTEYHNKAAMEEGLEKVINTDDSRNYPLVKNTFSLVQVLCSEMSNGTFRKSLNDLLLIGKGLSRFGAKTLEEHLVLDQIRHNTRSRMGLGGTPLNNSLMVLPNVIEDFKKKFKSELVTAVIITDGDDSDSIVGTENYIRPGYKNWSGTTAESFLHDEQTKKSYKIENTITNSLLKCVRDRTGCKLVGFFLTAPRSYTLDMFVKRNGLCNETSSTLAAKLRKEKSVIIPSEAYDAYYLIADGDSLRTYDDDLDSFIGDKVVTNRQLTTAFQKMNRGRLENRVILSKFIEEIA